MSKQKLLMFDREEVIDLIEAILEKFELDADETSISKLISELKETDE